jgi:general stress protein 26
MTDGEKLYPILAEFDTAMLVTLGADTLQARPMAMAGVHDDGSLWLVTGVGSRLIEELARDPRVCLTFQRRASYVAVEGRASIVEEPACVRELWSQVMDLWVPGGPADPGAVALRVVPGSVEHWDGKGRSALRFVPRMPEASLARVGRDGANGRMKRP